MSAHLLMVPKKPPAGVRRTKMHFWDGLEATFMMPSVTPEERRAVWDAVAAHLQEQLLLHKGVRIPTLGSFDVVPKHVRVGDEVVTIQNPRFYLARNLTIVHNLMDNKSYLPGEMVGDFPSGKAAPKTEGGGLGGDTMMGTCSHGPPGDLLHPSPVFLPGNKELEPLKYSKVATSMSRKKVEDCIMGTLSLLSHCLAKGENVALVLKDVGLLLIEGTKVRMRFYHNFLEMLSGKENLEKVLFKVPKLLDMMVSPVVPVASLTFSGRVIIFPEFVMESVPKPPPRLLPKTPGPDPTQDQQMRKESLPPLRKKSLPPLWQDGQVRFPGFPVPGGPEVTPGGIPMLCDVTGGEKKKKKKKKKKRKNSGVRKRLVTSGDNSAKEQPGIGQGKGQGGPKGPAAQKNQEEMVRTHYRGGKGEGGGGKRGGRKEERGGEKGEGGKRGEGKGEGEGGGERGEDIVEKILADLAVGKKMKTKPSHLGEAPTSLTPIVAVLSATSSQSSLLEEPTQKVTWWPPPGPRGQNRGH
ncbi:PREDICTED: coiled-coil domain-containing protein 81 isoform X1 [Calidris pugnax]|uniref:coiled-coil domain-containing protein 81 isoform X1 n=1 Tax=Calidris pugnax TaxID=198806 RepID=UPI00071CD2FE|nr:PREDICTED: coiled-coil domain-containing protein 81 isoform X1 [Calidris pugnax]